MAGSSQFIPSLNSITTNQDLQWLVQPSLGPPPGPSQSPRPPYLGLPGMRPLGHRPSQTHLYRPGVIRAASHPTGSTRRRVDEHVRTFAITFLITQSAKGVWVKKNPVLRL